jgi:hypothetical protein
MRRTLRRFFLWLASWFDERPTTDLNTSDVQEAFLLIAEFENVPYPFEVWSPAERRMQGAARGADQLTPK